MAEQDAVVFFIRHEPFQINFIDLPPAPRAPSAPSVPR